FRYGDGELAEEEHDEGRYGEGYDDAPVRIQHAESDGHLVQRQHNDFHRHHHDKQHEHEHQVSPFERVFRQAVAHHRAGHERQERVQHRNRHTVEKPGEVNF